MSTIFKGTLTICFSIALAALAAVAAAWLWPATAEAHVDFGEVPVETIGSTPIADGALDGSDVLFGSYVYQAQSGDNLTYFARRSVQLFLATSAMELDVARLIAAETMIVRDLGGFELAVGQEVSIDVALVGQRVYEAYLLNETSLMRWGMYAPIRQSLDHIEPLAVPQSLAAEPTVETESETEPMTAEPTADSDATSETPSQTTTLADEETDAAASETEIVADNATATRDSSFYFTLLGGLILMGIVVWVLVLSFLRNTKEEAEAAASGEEKAGLKDKLTDAKLTKKIKDLPKTVASKGDKPKKAKIVKKKPKRNSRKQ